MSAHRRRDRRGAVPRRRSWRRRTDCGRNPHLTAPSRLRNVCSIPCDYGSMHSISSSRGTTEGSSVTSPGRLSSSRAGLENPRARRRRRARHRRAASSTRSSAAATSRSRSCRQRRRRAQGRDRVDTRADPARPQSPCAERARSVSLAAQSAGDQERADHHADGADDARAIASPGSTWARTTTSPNRSARASSPPACAPCCAAAATTPSRR